jgi:hypothetical protein
MRYMRDADERAAAVAVLPVGVLTVLYGLALTAFSIGGTDDTPCGSLIDPSFHPPFDTEQLCGMMHLGTLVLVVGLIIGGCTWTLVAALALRGHVRVTATAWVATGVSAAAVLGWALLAWRVANLDAFHSRGWTPVRNLVGYSAIGLVLAAAVTDLVVLASGRRLRGSAR